MNIIILLIGISLSIAVGFLGLFLWNIRSGQFEDTLTPSIRMLFDEPKAGKEKGREPPVQQPDKSQVSD